MSDVAGWRTVCIADVAVVDPETIGGSGEGLIDYVSLEDVSKGRIAERTQVKLADAPSRARRKLRPGDVLFGTVRPNLQSHAQYKGGFSNPVASTGFAVIRARPGASVPGFLAHWVLGFSASRQVDRLIAGSNYPAVSSGDVRRLQISLPDVTTQAAIASALDDADDLIASLERLIDKKRAMRQGLMQHLLTGRSRLPGFAGAWRSIRLGDYVKYVNTVPLSRAQLDETSPLRYLHYGDIHSCVQVRLNAAAKSMPRAAGHLVGRAGRLQAGDLVFVDASEDLAGVGKSVEITDVPQAGMVPGLHTIAARFDKTVLADGFKGYLQFIPSVRENLLRLAAGTKVLATTRSHISSIALPLPSVDEQKAIAEVLSAADQEIYELRRRVAKTQDIKLGMMRALLTGRIRLSTAKAAA